MDNAVRQVIYQAGTNVLQIIVSTLKLSPAFQLFAPHMAKYKVAAEFVVSVLMILNATANSVRMPIVILNILIMPMVRNRSFDLVNYHLGLNVLVIGNAIQIKLNFVIIPKTTQNLEPA